MAESSSHEPRGFCRVCRKRQPLKWKPSCISGPTTDPELAAAAAPAEPIPVSAPAVAEPAAASKFCDLLGNEVEQTAGLRAPSKPGAGDLKKRSGESPASFWFVCGVCGSPEIDVEYVSMDQAIERNRAAKK